eukprot:TRINITY_DN8291_c0_g1_i7.p1 TRINITY_DN8291_c0_g1~~TRINITY_DN8291_c0_g1_i7.p1  ORF type:complete len:240 (-),score=12.13 TRINITY_DN8291_c0_g1_i7:82-801(-)
MVIRDTKESDEPARFEGISCDFCKKSPIIGVRSKCVECPDFDLCPDCMKSRPHPHAFSMITQPSKGRFYKGLAAVTHNDVFCDVCKTSDIKGIRYKCTTCPDFDLCSNCFPSPGHALHSFVAIVTSPFEVNLSYNCDGCRSSIPKAPDVRYRCTICPNFDFCEKCMKNNHHPHSFIRVKSVTHPPAILQNPLLVNQARELQKRFPILDLCHSFDILSENPPNPDQAAVNYIKQHKLNLK